MILLLSVFFAAFADLAASAAVAAVPASAAVAAFAAFLLLSLLLLLLYLLFLLSNSGQGELGRRRAALERLRQDVVSSGRHGNSSSNTNNKRYHTAITMRLREGGKEGGRALRS